VTTTKLIVVVPSVVGDRPRWWVSAGNPNPYARGSVDSDCEWAIGGICDDLHLSPADDIWFVPDAAIISIEMGQLGMTDDGDPAELRLCEREQRGRR
jgi:hypothetical protein